MSQNGSQVFLWVFAELLVGCAGVYEAYNPNSRVRRRRVKMGHGEKKKKEIKTCFFFVFPSLTELRLIRYGKGLIQAGLGPSEWL